jgi:hypothetical protein
MRFLEGLECLECMSYMKGGAPLLEGGQVRKWVQIPGPQIQREILGSSTAQKNRDACIVCTILGWRLG